MREGIKGDKFFILAKSSFAPTKGAFDKLTNLTIACFGCVKVLAFGDYTLAGVFFSWSL